MEKKQQPGKRILMSALGVAICGVSVGMFKHAALGVDPFQSLMSDLDAVIPIHFGTLYVIANLLLLTFALVFDRRKIGLATLINLFLLGYIAEFSQTCVARLVPAPALIWSEKQSRIPFPLCRVITDLVCVFAGAVLCLAAGFSLRRITGEVGVGTIITAFFMGPLIQFFNVRIARPFLYGKDKTES